MEIRCPGCNNTVDVGETENDIVCPHCRRPLEITLGHEGFALVGVAGPAPEESAPDDLSHDPIVEDYTQWRGRAVFIMLFGAVCALILAISVARGLAISGTYYFTNSKNLFFAGIFCMLSTVFIGGGVWLFRYLGRERARYMAVKKNSE